MGTHCALRLVAAGRRLTQYVHYDGAEVLGRVTDALGWLLGGGLTLEQVGALVADLRPAGDAAAISAEALAHLVARAGPAFVGRARQDWYDLLRPCQGDLVATLWCGVIADDAPDAEEVNVEVDFDLGAARSWWSADEAASPPALALAAVAPTVAPDAETRRRIAVLRAALCGAAQRG